MARLNSNGKEHSWVSLRERSRRASATLILSCACAARVWSIKLRPDPNFRTIISTHERCSIVFGDCNTVNPHCKWERHTYDLVRILTIQVLVLGAPVFNFDLQNWQVDAQNQQPTSSIPHKLFKCLQTSQDLGYVVVNTHPIHRRYGSRGVYRRTASANSLVSCTSMRTSLSSILYLSISADDDTPQIISGSGWQTKMILR